MTMQRRIQIIVNPAAGQDIPVLGTFNTVFRECGYEWELSITKQAGDAELYARQAAAQGVDVVAAYGGDGTVAEVASGLAGTGVPMAILPGGTANVMSVELGIPTDLAAACRVACDPNHTIRAVDMGLVNDHHFILRVGIGFEAAMVEQADRELKNRLGVFAYLWSAVQNLSQPVISHYHLTIDGKEIETDGLTCLIANSGNLGQAGVNLIPSINVSDGLLDVIVVQQASLRSLFDILGSITGLKQVASGESGAEIATTQTINQTIQYWQGKEVSLSATPEQTAQYDGEVLGKVPVHCHILPGAVSVVIPSPV
ncbi:MAG TPA: diacylglycerol kinase family lipid kinase [Caldilineaceae bacterium]|nr:diacylglycerol kinase family lipid kinase [Caldilineaceae bacterium]